MNLKRILDKNDIPDWRIFDTIGSTNDEAIRWLNKNAQEYCVVIADAQTAGRGRQKRKWVTTPGASIAITIILKPNINEIQKLGLFSLLGGLAVRKTIETLYGIKAKVKWPNDVLINEKKSAGILAETVWERDLLKGLVLGIGINLYKEAIPPKETLIYPATCIQDHTLERVKPIDVVDALLKNIKDFRSILLDEIFIETYTHTLAFKGEEVTLHRVNSLQETGILIGIDHSGNLLLKKATGEIQSFTIGDVSLRKG